MREWENILRKYMDASDRPIYIRIYQGIKEYAGSLEEDSEKLPPVRSLAEQLGVNNGTVMRAYQKLEEEGLIYTHTGRGTFLKKVEGNPFYDQSRIHEMESWNWQPGGLEPGGINFATSTPSPDFFPVDSFKETMNQVLDRDGGRAFGYQDGRGYYPLREAVCEYLGNQGVATLPASLQITTGAQQGIDLAAKALIKAGDVVYVERPSYTGAMAAFASRGGIVLDVPMDEWGMDPNVLENLVRKKQPRLVYIMPNFQSPTGLTYSEQRRADILYLADKYNFWLVEDDYLGELSFGAAQYHPIKKLDEGGRVIYLKSFSKIFMPGLRLGFMILPDELQEPVEQAKRYSDVSTSGLLQRAFEIYLRSGRWVEYLDFLKGVYKERHSIMEKSLSEYRDLFGFHPPGGGLAFWVSIHRKCEDVQLADKAKHRGVFIYPGQIFYIHKQEKDKIRLGYAYTDAEQIARGIDILAEILWPQETL